MEGAEEEMTQLIWRDESKHGRELVLRCNCSAMHFLTIYEMDKEFWGITETAFDVALTVWAKPWKDRFRAAWSALFGQKRDWESVLVSKEAAKVIAEFLNDCLEGE